MSYVLCDPQLREDPLEFDDDQWTSLLRVARDHNWMPIGSIPEAGDWDGLVEEACGEGLRIPGMRISDIDARSLADALERALPLFLPFRPPPYGVLRSDAVIDVIGLLRRDRDLLVIDVDQPLTPHMTVLDAQTLEVLDKYGATRAMWSALQATAKEHGWLPTGTERPPRHWEGSARETEVLMWRAGPLARPRWRGDYSYGVISKSDARAFAGALERALPRIPPRIDWSSPYSTSTSKVEEVIRLCRSHPGLFVYRS